MNRLPAAAALAFVGFIMASPAHARSEEPVTVVVQGVSPEVARAIKRQATQGKAALIRYLERGRFIYEVRVERVAPKTR